jgi:hypothetical protein
MSNINPGTECLSQELQWQANSAMVLASSRKIITKVLKKKRLTLKEKKARKEKTQQTIKNERNQREERRTLK